MKKIIGLLGITFFISLSAQNKVVSKLNMPSEIRFLQNTYVLQNSVAGKNSITETYTAKDIKNPSFKGNFTVSQTGDISKSEFSEYIEKDLRRDGKKYTKTKLSNGDVIFGYYSPKTKAKDSEMEIVEKRMIPALKSDNYYVVTFETSIKNAKDFNKFKEEIEKNFPLLEFPKPIN